MSNLSGHDRLTLQAVNELRSECVSHPLMRGLGDAGLSIDVVMRDILDVLILGHWADFGQAHHFMRRFDGQSPLQAYEEGVEWIRSNALDTAGRISSIMPKYFRSQDWVSGVSPTASYRTQCTSPELAFKQRNDIRGTLVLSRSIQGDWQSFGNAIHALEDSFAAGHAEREKGSSRTPGAIKHIRRYAGKEKDKHEHYDELWWNESSGTFSDDGRYAISAVKELILMVCTTAIRARGKTPYALVCWNELKDTWLVASPNLSRERDADYEFVERFTTVIRLGNNSMTVNCDEAGMAEAMIKEFGTDLARVSKVFQRLKEHHITDSDDIACEYVERVQKNEKIAEALQRDKPLINQLEGLMHMTDSDQAKCIVYLSNLRHKK